MARDWAAPERPWWVRYGLTLLAVAAATLLRQAVDPLWGQTSPYIFYFPAVMIAVVIGGRGPALLATALGGLIGISVFVPEGDLRQLWSAAEVLRLATFVGSGVFIAYLGGALRDAKLQTQEGVRRLQESEDRFRRMADGMPFIVWVHDADGRQEFVNQTFCEFFGVSREDMRGDSWQPLMHPADAPAYVTEFLRCVRDRRPFHALVRARRADGQWRWIESYGRPRFDDAGRFFGYVGSSPDVTERVQAEATLRQTRDDLAAANRAKDQFFAVLSHELRTPLTPVLAAVQMMEDQADLPAGLRPTVELIRRNISLEARLIDDLLDLTRITRGKLELNFSEVDLHAQVRQAVQMVEAEATAKRLDLQCHLEAAGLTVRADPARLQQVLWNLLKNAVKFTPAGGAIRVRTADGPDGVVRLEVADTGVGIEPDVLARVFDAFEQGGGAITRQFGGLGLGLAISKALAEAHGGKILAHSDGKGKGARFTLELPAAAPSAAAPGPRPDRQADGDLRGVHVLLVDDHADTTTMMAKVLRAQGCRVWTAGSLAAAVQVAADQPLDVVVSDIGLPDGTGYDLMKQLAVRHRLRGIALSGFGMDDDLRKSEAAGFAAHLTKPVDVQALKQAIGRVVRG